MGIDNGNTGDTVVALEQIVVAREHLEEPVELAAQAADNSVLDTAEELADTADILCIVGLAEEGLEDIAGLAEELACNAAELADTDDIQEE